MYENTSLPRTSLSTVYTYRHREVASRAGKKIAVIACLLLNTQGGGVRLRKSLFDHSKIFQLMGLLTRQSERPGHQQRLLQTFTEVVFIFSLLVYIAH